MAMSLYLVPDKAFPVRARVGLLCTWLLVGCMLHYRCSYSIKQYYSYSVRVRCVLLLHTPVVPTTVKYSVTCHHSLLVLLVQQSHCCAQPEPVFNKARAACRISGASVTRIPGTGYREYPN